MIAISGGKELVQITVTAKEYHEFRELVSRATNTWDQMPPWVRVLADTLQDNPGTQHF